MTFFSLCYIYLFNRFTLYAQQSNDFKRKRATLINWPSLLQWGSMDQLGPYLTKLKVSNR
jgi:hypothetical protein